MLAIFRPSRPVKTVWRVGPVKFGERHGKRTNWQHNTAADRWPTKSGKRVASKLNVEVARYSRHPLSMLVTSYEDAMRKLLRWNLGYRPRTIIVDVIGVDLSSQVAQLRSPVLTATGLVNGNPSFLTPPRRIDVP